MKADFARQADAFLAERARLARLSLGARARDRGHEAEAARHYAVADALRPPEADIEAIKAAMRAETARIIADMARR